MQRLIRYAKKGLFEALQSSFDDLSNVVSNNKTLIETVDTRVTNVDNRLSTVENNYVAEGANTITLENGTSIQASEGGISFYDDTGKLLGTLSKEGGMKNGMLGFNAAKHTDAPIYASGGTLDYADKDCFYVGTSSEIHNIKEGRYVGHIICLMSYDNHSGFFIMKDGNVKAFKATKVNIRGYAASATLMWNGTHWICIAYNNWDDFA